MSIDLFQKMIRMKTIRQVLLTSFLLLSVTVVQAQELSPTLNSYKFSVMAGVAQPILLRGVNIAGTYMTNHLYFEYSHGMFLHYEKTGMTSSEKQNLSAIYVPYSTGGGVGYRFNNNLQAFWELKVHKFQPTVKSTSEKFSYNTFEMGPAISYRLFFNKNKSFFAEPVVRYWFTTAVFGNNDFNGRDIIIRNADNTTFVHRAHQHALFANISVGIVIK